MIKHLYEKASGVGSMDVDDGRQNSDDYFKFPSGPRDVIQYDDTDDVQHFFGPSGNEKQTDDFSPDKKFKRLLKQRVFVTEAQKHIVASSKVVDDVLAIHQNRDDFDEGDLIDRIYFNDSYELKMIPIEDIVSPWHADEFKVDDYVKRIGDKGDYPPIVVDAERNGTYEIIDGTHRYEALKLLGRKVVKAYAGVKDEL